MVLYTMDMVTVSLAISLLSFNSLPITVLRSKGRDSPGRREVNEKPHLESVNETIDNRFVISFPNRTNIKCICLTSTPINSSKLVIYILWLGIHSSD